MRNIFYVKGSEICPIQSLCGCLVMLWRPFVSSANIGKFPSNTSAYRVNTIYRPSSSVTSHHVTLRTGGQASVCLQHGGESDYEAWVVTRLF